MKKRVFEIMTIVFVMMTNLIAFGEDYSTLYRFNPNDATWKDMSYVEQLEAINIPKEELAVLDNDTIVELALEYPFAVDILLFGDYNTGFKHLVDTSNVFFELTSREDIRNAVYKKILNLKEDEKVGKIVLNTALAYINKDMDKGIERGLAKLLKMSEGIGLNRRSMLEGSSYFIPGGAGVYLYFDDDYTEYTICTGGIYHKYDKNASCYRYESNDWTQNEKNYFNQQMQIAHPSWIFKSTATKKYNCHSYVWIDRNYSNIYWLDDPSVYTTATAYFTTTMTNGPVSIGQHITIHSTQGLAHSVYVVGASSGTTTTSYMTTARVVSKLGTQGVYETSLYDMYNLYSGVYYKPYTVL